MSENTAKGIPVHVCFLGDGLVTGFGDPNMMGYTGRLSLLAKRHSHNLISYNLGIVGDTSENLLKRADAETDCRLGHVHNGRIVVQIGHEDSRSIGGKAQFSTKETLSNLFKTLAPLVTKYKVILIGCAPVYDPQHNQRITRLNMGLNELSKKLKIPFINIYPNLANDVQYKRELGASDKVHPGSKGYEKIFQLIAEDRAWWFGGK